MTCHKCGTIMLIDEWNGWKWSCFNCGHVGRCATNSEIELLENEDTNDL